MSFEQKLYNQLGFIELTGHYHGLRYWNDPSDEIKMLLMIQEDTSYHYAHLEDTAVNKPYINRLFRELTCLHHLHINAVFGKSIHYYGINAVNKQPLIC